MANLLVRGLVQKGTGNEKGKALVRKVRSIEGELYCMPQVVVLFTPVHCSGVVCAYCAVDGHIIRTLPISSANNPGIDVDGAGPEGIAEIDEQLKHI